MSKSKKIIIEFSLIMPYNVIVGGYRYMKKKEKIKSKKEVKTSKFSSLWKSFSDNTPKLKKKDFVILGVLMIFYLIISFYHLGTLQTPKTYYQFQYEGEDIGVEIAGVSQ